MSERRASFLHLFFFSLYSGWVRIVVGSAAVTIIPLGYLISIYAQQPCFLNSFYYSAAESGAMPLFLAAFPIMATQGLTDKTRRLSIFGPHTRSKVLAALMASTFLIGILTVFLAVAVLSIANYDLIAASLGHCAPQTLPSMSVVLSSWLLRYAGASGVYLYLMLLAFTLFIWGSRFLGDSVNTLFTVAVSFFGGVGLQFQIMLVPFVRYFTFTYYMYALGSLLTGLDGTALGFSQIDIPGFLPLTFFGIFVTIAFFLSLAWIGFTHQDVGVE